MKPSKTETLVRLVSTHRCHREMQPGNFPEARASEGDSESPAPSEDWVLHLTGGLSFYFSTAAVYLWDQAKANTDVRLISNLLSKVSQSLLRQTTPGPSTKSWPQSTPSFLGAAFKDRSLKVNPPFLTKHNQSP